MSIHVGIDVAKNELVVHALPQEQRRCFANSAQGRAELVAWLSALGADRVLFEASGGYEASLLLVLHEAALPAVRISADRPRQLAQALGLKAKTDALDARMLAVAAQLLPAPVSKPLPEATERLRQCVHLRTALVGERDSHRRRLQQISDPTAHAIQHACMHQRPAATDQATGHAHCRAAAGHLALAGQGAGAGSGPACDLGCAPA
ncbi:hypothetical protein ATCM_11870 [Stenotrophomonas sp. ATCM1_4]|uniref:IS110 family transposase n=1 Tax=Stenotrophomonas sp. ATCM1_4 TaxID=2259330 RepID=UPI00104CA95F|nr:transposase [Stenotrophomonas sp. ATCM1_4]TDB28298.1 hypothetical protein ATCM_11870 [Stenotrophomonas sp. ATCM1_4]